MMGENVVVRRKRVEGRKKKGPRVKENETTLRLTRSNSVYLRQIASLLQRGAEIEHVGVKEGAFVELLHGD